MEEDIAQKCSKTFFLMSCNTDFIQKSVGILLAGVYQTLVRTVKIDGVLNIKSRNLTALNKNLVIGCVQDSWLQS